MEADELIDSTIIEKAVKKGRKRTAIATFLARFVEKCALSVERCVRCSITGKSKKLSLTAQTASSEKNLKRRIIMIKNKKRTNRFIVTISVIIAVVILSIAVFASGILSNSAKNNYTTVEKTSQYDSTTPEYVIDQFFYLFENSDFDNMKMYCTQNCIDNFFGNDYVFGMKKATLQNISTDDDSALKGFTDGEWVAQVKVKMTPGENSVFDPKQTETSLYLILKQQNGKYLIDEFATGL